MRFFFREIVKIWRNEHFFRVIIIALVILLGALHAWASRYTMNPDGISYLDLGEAFWREGAGAIVNAHWSPLYAWLLGSAVALVKPSIFFEFPLIHLVNFFIYLFAFGTFLFFARSLLAWIHPFDHRFWLLFSTVLFLITALRLITLEMITPDLFVAAFVFLMSGLLVAIMRGDTRAYIFAALGAAAGFGYLAKASLFPVSLLFFCVAFFAQKNWRGAIPRLLLACGIFAFIATPLVMALSEAHGYFTFGESGRLNYAWHINNVQRYIHWEGGEGFGAPLHPARKILAEPAVYEFAEPIGGTYPLWYDPAYWYQGVAPRFDAKGHLRALVSNTKLLYEIGKDTHLLVFVLGWLLLASFAWRETVRRLFLLWPLFLAAGGGLGMYMILLAQARYVAPFLAVLILGAFAALPWAHDGFAYGIAKRVILGLIFITVIALVGFSLDRVQNRTPPTNAFIADTLLREGIIKKGDAVAIAARHFPAWISYWARLARLTIVADNLVGVVVGKNDFWFVDDTSHYAALSAFASTGARVVLANDPPPHVSLVGWRRVGETAWYVFDLQSLRENN